jgi:hypothetical protein
MMALLMSRVESTSPPGVRNEMTTSARPVGVRLRDHLANVFRRQRGE